MEMVTKAGGDVERRDGIGYERKVGIAMQNQKEGGWVEAMEGEEKWATWSREQWIMIGWRREKEV